MADAKQADFWRLFSRVLGRPVEPGCYTPEDLPQWDSLRHVELVFELEETFGIQVPQSRIASLYTDTDQLLALLHDSGAG
jgi:hypothetical protein